MRYTSTRPPIQRMIYLDLQLRDNKYPNCFAVGKYFEVSHKTILNDIHYLRNSLGAPIEFDNSKNGYFYTEPNFFLPAINLTEGEIFAFAVIDKILEQYKNTPFEEQLRKIYNKLLLFLPDKVKIKPKELQSDYFFKTNIQFEIDKQIYDRISQAVKEENEIKISYRGLMEEKESNRTIQPYYLINKQGDWYVFAFCKMRKDFRLFAMHRIRSAEITEEFFNKDENINTKNIIGDGLDIIAGGGNYYCEIRIKYPASLYVQEKKWHPTQKIKFNRDKSINLSFTVNSLREVIRWILSMGSDAEVIKPKLLKNEMIEEIKRINKVYKKLNDK
jgi:predicted DNA-binding transcriptional regulator YafY